LTIHFIDTKGFSMFGSSRFGAARYQTTHVETGVLDADPHALIVMLFEGARLQVGRALFACDQKDTFLQGLSTGNAIAIISEGLNNSLSWKADALMADRLSALYEYMVFRLSEANSSGRREGFQEVDKLLAELESAWRAIKPKREAAPVSPPLNRSAFAA
jgi:flagellar protein FliS